MRDSWTYLLMGHPIFLLNNVRLWLFMSLSWSTTGKANTFIQELSLDRIHMVLAFHLLVLSLVCSVCICCTAFDLQYQRTVLDFMMLLVILPLPLQSCGFFLKFINHQVLRWVVFFLFFFIFMKTTRVYIWIFYAKI